MSRRKPSPTVLAWNLVAVIDGVITFALLARHETDNARQMLIVCLLALALAKLCELLDRQP